MKKLLPILLLTLCLALPLCADASADEAQWGPSVSYGTSGTLVEAFVYANGLPNGSTAYIQLLSNVSTKNTGELTLDENKTAVLDLNGKKIDRELTAAITNGYVLRVDEKAHLTLRDTGKGGMITGGWNSDRGGGVYITNGSLTLESGAISGNKAYSGGGVYVYSTGADSDTGGSLLMSGGSIKGNTARDGGGVALAHANLSAKVSTFTMSGGSITDNTASDGESSPSGNGGGVVIGGDAHTGNDVFNFSDGAIHNNHAADMGGGIICNGTLNMTGGTVTGNDCLGGLGYGGGICVTETANLRGGSITGNSILNPTGGFGGGVYVEANATLVTLDGSIQITGNVASKSASNLHLFRGKTVAVVNNSGAPFTGTVGVTTEAKPTDDAPVTFAVKAGDSALDASRFFSDNASYYVHGNSAGGLELVTRSSAEALWGNTSASYPNPGTLVEAFAYANSLPSGSTAYIQLQNNVSTKNTGELILDIGRTAVLDLNGKTINRELTVPVDDGYVLAVLENAALTLEDSASGGKITGGNDHGCGAGCGGGVFLMGTLTFKGGTITGNTAASLGGGVFIASNGTLSLEGGTISGNTAHDFGGGVYTDGRLEVSAGSITGNTATHGGGAYVDLNGTLSLKGGTITRNTASRFGGGAYINGRLEASAGSITGNTNGTAASNAYLNGRLVSVASGFNGSIGLSVSSAPTVDLPVTVTTRATGDTADYSACFTSDNAAYAVGRNSAGDVALFLPAHWTGLTANGDQDTPTTALTLTLDADVAGLSADCFTVTGATKGALTKESGTGIYTLAVSDITAEDQRDLTVSVAKTGVIFLPASKTVAARRDYAVTATGGKAYIGTTEITRAMPGQTVKIVATGAASGHAFTRWAVTPDTLALDDATKATATFTMPAGDVTATAQYEKETYTLAYDLDGGKLPEGKSNPTTYTVETEAFTLVHPVRDGYAFKGWSGTGLTGEENTAVTIVKGSTGNRDYTAHWTLISYPVTVTGGKAYVSGTTTELAQAAPGDTVDLKADAPAKNQRFKRWVVAQGGVVPLNATKGETSFVMGAQAVVVSAEFEPYTILEGSGGTHVLGSDEPMTLRCNGDNSLFDHLSLDGTNVDPTYYDRFSGSTVVTLHSVFLNQLALGEHAVSFHYTDGGAATAKLYIGVRAPQTGDSAQPWLYALGALVAAVALVLLLRRRTPKTNK